MSADESQMAGAACLLVFNFAVNNQPVGASRLSDFSLGSRKLCRFNKSWSQIQRIAFIRIT